MSQEKPGIDEVSFPFYFDDLVAIARAKTVARALAFRLAALIGKNDTAVLLLRALDCELGCIYESHSTSEERAEAATLLAKERRQTRAIQQLAAARNKEFAEQHRSAAQAFAERRKKPS